jgi:hypothetical protein
MFSPKFGQTQDESGQNQQERHLAEIEIRIPGDEGIVTAWEICHRLKDVPEAASAVANIQRVAKYGPRYQGEDFDVLAHAYQQFLGEEEPIRESSTDEKALTNRRAVYGEARGSAAVKSYLDEDEELPIPAGDGELYAPMSTALRAHAEASGETVVNLRMPPPPTAEDLMGMPTRASASLGLRLETSPEVLVKGHDRKALEEMALGDHRKALGTVVESEWIRGFIGDDSKEISCGEKDKPFKVLVLDTREEDLRHWTDEILDPYWEVDLAEPHPAIPEGFRSPWVYGPSYELVKEKAAAPAAPEPSPGPGESMTAILTGSTYPHKKDIHEMGGVWQKDRKAWVVRDADQHREAIQKMADLGVAVEWKVELKEEPKPAAEAEPGLAIPRDNVPSRPKDTRETGFRGAFEAFSNFYPCKIEHDGRTFRCLEAAYMAAKFTDPEHQALFQELDGRGAKALGKKSHPSYRQDWDTVKIQVMRDLLATKFTEPELKEWLLATDGIELVEANTWNDTFWGECRGQGENHLGKLLMELRGRLLSPADPQKEGPSTVEIPLDEYMAGQMDVLAAERHLGQLRGTLELVRKELAARNAEDMAAFNAIPASRSDEWSAPSRHLQTFGYLIATIDENLKTTGDGAAPIALDQASVESLKRAVEAAWEAARDSSSWEANAELRSTAIEQRLVFARVFGSREDAQFWETYKQQDRELASQERTN